MTDTELRTLHEVLSRALRIIEGAGIGDRVDGRDRLGEFLCEKVHHVPGQAVLYSDLYDQFVAGLTPAERTTWTKPRFSKELPDAFPVGSFGGKNQRHVGNLSWKPAEPGVRLVADGKRLRPEAIYKPARPIEPRFYTIDGQRFVTSKELARLAGVDVTIINADRNRGIINWIKDGSSVFIPEAEVERYLRHRNSL